MNKLEAIKELFSVMNSVGVTLNDLNAYANNQSVPQVSSSACKLPLEVLYDGDYRSFFFEPLKTPIAIIVGNVGVAFEDAPEPMNWYNANSFCEKYSLGEKEWSLPNKKAGHLKALYENKNAFNVTLKAFGKEPLKEAWYWASEYEYSSNYAWILNLSDGSVYYNNKGNSDDYVRPVLLF